VGISQSIGPWTLEIQAAATFFTDNENFFGGNSRSQDPLYSLQGHAIYGSRSGIWAREGFWSLLRSCCRMC
jgi:hypothetical protein